MMFLPPIDRAVVRDPFMHREERIAERRMLDHIEVLPQPEVFGELVDAVMAGRNFRVGRRGVAAAELRAEILFHRGDKLPRGFQLGQNLFGKTAAEPLFERGDDLHPLQRIHAGLDDRRIERHALRAILAHAADFFEHDFGHGPLRFDAERPFFEGAAGGETKAVWSAVSTHRPSRSLPTISLPCGSSCNRRGFAAAAIGKPSAADQQPTTSNVPAR